MDNFPLTVCAATAAILTLSLPAASHSQVVIDDQLEAERRNLDWRGSYTAHGINAVFLEAYWTRLVLITRASASKATPASGQRGARGISLSKHYSDCERVFLPFGSITLGPFQNIDRPLGAIYGAGALLG